MTYRPKKTDAPQIFRRKRDVLAVRRQKDISPLLASTRENGHDKKGEGDCNP